MSWRALTVEIDAADAESLSDALLAHGAASVDATDALAGTSAERPLFDEPGADSAGWSRVRLRALVAIEADARALLAAAAAEAGLAAVPGHALEPVPDEDWVLQTQAQFGPIRISDRLWIVPSWREPPEPGALNIRLNPGLAFGTGSHPTTRACLEWLERHVAAGDVVLDYGCGSGILAIAAAKLGAGRVVGVDIDPDAVCAARGNAEQNAAAAQFVPADEPLDLAADLVVANILARPLAVLAPVLAAFCRPGGRIALAGILADQAAHVASAYAQWFDMGTFTADDGWVTLEGVRR